MEKELLQILQHSLGLDQFGQGRRYRNYYVAGPDDAEKCRKLTLMDYMVELKASELTGGDPVFQVTRAGVNAVAIHSPKPPKLTRSQRRYQEFLKLDCELTFGELLKTDYCRLIK